MVCHDRAQNDPMATNQRADMGDFEKTQRRDRPLRGGKVWAPSPIRTLPSVPESHRIVLVEPHALADYTAGRDLIVITRDLTQTPKAVLPEL
jgi:hypothetical protein